MLDFYSFTIVFHFAKIEIKYDFRKKNILIVIKMLKAFPIFVWLSRILYKAGWQKWSREHPDWYARRSTSTHPDWYNRERDTIRRSKAPGFMLNQIYKIHKVFISRLVWLQWQHFSFMFAIKIFI